MDSASKKQKENQRINVYVRCRPLNDNEKKQLSHSIVETISDNKIVVKETCNDRVYNRTFTFDKVFGPSASQMEIYDVVAHSLINDVIKGYNCTIFVYGQTGTGKTYTMEGERFTELCAWEKDPKAGIIPRALHQLFEMLDSSALETAVSVSFMELYNEELYDLLSPSNDIAKLKLFETSNQKGSVLIQGLEEIPVFEKCEVFSIFEKGAARRQKAATLLNASSNRSHTVFSAIVRVREINQNKEVLKIGKLNLVDLAGSENIGRSGAVDRRAREAGSINQSLLTLGRVITALVEKGPHVPYRESKLTRILQDSLGGHTKTSIVATISPALCNVEETLSTLDYAFRAKDITNKPEVNQKMSNNCLIQEYAKEIDLLRKDLAACKEKRGVLVDVKTYNSLKTDLVRKTEYLKELKAVKDDLIEQLEKSKRSLAMLRSALENKENLLSHQVCFEIDLDTRLQKVYKELKISKQAENVLSFQLAELYQSAEANIKVEQDIQKSSQQLLGTCDKVTSDMSGLFRKLSSMDEMESQNNRKREKYYKESQELFEIFFSTIFKLKDEYPSKLSNLSCEVDNSLKTWNFIVDVKTSCFNDLVNLHNGMFETLNTHISQINEKSCDVAMAREEQVSFHGYFASYSQRIQNAFDIAYDLLLKQNAAINNFHKFVKDQIEIQQQIAREFIKKIREHLESANNELLYLKQEEEMLIIGEHTNKLRIVDEDSSFEKKWIEQLNDLTSILESMRNLNLRHKQFKGKSLLQNEENINVMNKLCNCKILITNVMKDEIEQMRKDFISNFVMSYKEMNSAQTHCLEENKALNYNLVQHEEKVKTLVESENIYTTIINEDERIKNLVMVAIQNTRNSNIEMARKQIQEFQKVLLNTAFPVKKIEEQCMHHLESMVSSERFLLTQCKEVVGKGDSLKAYLTLIKLRLDDFMGETLKEERTGNTPENQCYHPSNILPFPRKSRYFNVEDKKIKQLKILQEIEQELCQERGQTSENVSSANTSIVRNDGSEASKVPLLKTPETFVKKTPSQKQHTKPGPLVHRQNSNLTPLMGKIPIDRRLLLLRSKTLNI